MFKTASGTITDNLGTQPLSVNFTETVFQDPNNIFCGGCLDFVYVFHNNGPAPNERYSMSSFGGFDVNVGINPFGSPQDPTTIDRSSLGDVIGFNFPGSLDIMPGQTTMMLVIQTTATGVEHGTVSAQDGVAGSAIAWAPAQGPAIPEPGSLMLMGTGLVAVGGFLRRSRWGKRN